MIFLKNPVNFWPDGSPGPDIPKIPNGLNPENNQETSGISSGISK